MAGMDSGVNGDRVQSPVTKEFRFEPGHVITRHLPMGAWTVSERLTILSYATTGLVQVLNLSFTEF